MGLHMGNQQDDGSGVPPAPHPSPTARALAAVPPHREPVEQPPWLRDSNLSSLLLPNLPVPQLPTDKQPLLLGETEAERHQTCPRLLFLTKLVREARSPSSCAHFHPKLIYKVIFPSCRWQSSASHSSGVADVAGSPFACQSGWLHPHPAPEKELPDLRGASASLCIPRAWHITFPSLSFPS